MWPRLVLLVLLGLTLPIRDAAACRCTHAPLRSAIARADAVFVGEITAVRRVGQHDELSVAVRGVWKGAVGATVVVRSTRSSCGVVTGGAKVGRVWLFTATLDGTALRVRQCDGSRRATATVRAAVTRIAGPPQVP
jgi:hypothetical protein